MRRFLCMALALTLLLGGCGGAAKPPDIQAAADGLLAGGAFEEPLLELDSSRAVLMYRFASYGVSQEDIKDCRIGVAQSVIGDEMAFFVMSSEEAAKAVYTALQAQVKTQSSAFEGYGPEQVPKFDAAIIKQSGTTVYLIVASDYDAVDKSLK
jgi:hypothetical protein